MQLLMLFVILFFVLALKSVDVALLPLQAIGDGLTRVGRSLSSRTRLLISKLRKPFYRTHRKQTASGKYAQRSAPRRQSYRQNLPMGFTYASVWLKLKYFFLGVVFSLLFAFLPLLFLLFLQDLPNPHELSLRHIPQTTKIYDRRGVLLYQLYAQQNRTLITLRDVPRSLQDATLAIEDKNFYSHPGFDLPAIIRAFIENMSGRSFQGGSTITQQLIKSSLLSPEQRISRKIKEVVLAFWTERLYTKQQILEMYFNQIPYGGTAWGAEAAAEVYFGKPVQRLNLAESSFLAGITAAPSTYSPYGPDPRRWKSRQKEVLGRMVYLGYISQDEAKKAAAETIKFQPLQTSLKAPHFVEYVKNLLIERYGLAAVERGGLTVMTSLDMGIQDEAQKIVTEEVAKASYLNVTNGASVVTDPRTGDILAMVGSKDFNDPNGGKVNLATAHRQPGSTVKVITYSAALSNGFTAATVLDDSPVTFPNPGGAAYTPVNYNGRYMGRVPLRLALANSLNIPAVKTLNQVGIPKMVTFAKNMGVRSWNKPSDYGLSITLGGAEATMLDMATVFGTLASDGKRTDLNPILKITDAKGAVLEEKHTGFQPQVVDPGVTYIISDILADNQSRAAAFGPNSVLVIPGHTVSVKTGTSDNKRDNWTIGYTDNYVVTVWVGNNDNSPMSPTLASGITGAAPIWNRIMTELLAKHPEAKRSIPPGITQRSCFGRMEYFVAGTEASVPCSRFIPVTPTLQPFWRRFR
jgi:1A family penicillin-binding protein